MSTPDDLVIAGFNELLSSYKSHRLGAGCALFFGFLAHFGL